jgi:hypothetical protein
LILREKVLFSKGFENLSITEMEAWSMWKRGTSNMEEEEGWEEVGLVEMHQEVKRGGGVEGYECMKENQEIEHS